MNTLAHASRGWWGGIGSTQIQYVTVSSGGGSSIFLQHVPIEDPSGEQFNIILTEEKRLSDFDIILIPKIEPLISERNFIITLIEEEKFDMTISEENNMIIPNINENFEVILK